MTKIIRHKLTDYKITKGKGFWLAERQTSTFIFNIKIWRRWHPITSPRKVGIWYIQMPRHFGRREAVVNFVNHELARLGSTKRYK